MLPEREKPDGLAPPPNAELRALIERWMDHLVENGTYTSAEMAALRDPNGVRSWAPPPLHGPRTTLAFLDKHVISGVELWQRKEPTGWFLDNLIRDQAPEFKGVGREVVENAMGWWASQFRRLDQPLRVHAMVREPGAVKWWTTFMNRPHDFSGAFVRAHGLKFDAVGWIVYPSP
jgi:hypothetical protein